jgi:hypothetical protein
VAVKGVYVRVTVIVYVKGRVVGTDDAVTDHAVVGLTVTTLAEGVIVRVLYDDVVTDIEGD